jgi:hypothetical protein
MSVVMKLSSELDGDIAEAFGYSLAIFYSLLLSLSKLDWACWTI